MLWSLAEQEMDLETFICDILVQVVYGKGIVAFTAGAIPCGWWIHTVDMFGSLFSV
jgi:hypothetical protein